MFTWYFVLAFYFPFIASKYCSISSYDTIYLENLQLYPESSRILDCQDKNTSYLSRKIFVYNFNVPSSQELSLNYDSIYSSLVKAFENESKIFLAYLIGDLQIILDEGMHIIKYDDFEYLNPEFFRRMMINITISPKSRAFSIINLKYASFYLFISGSLQIKNIKFFGNDINWKNYSSECYNDPINFCCPAGSSNENCLINEKIIRKSAKSFGLLNLDRIIDNTLEMNSFLSLENCEFENLNIFNFDGFTSLINVAAFSAFMNLNEIHFLNCLFPSGILFYSGSGEIIPNTEAIFDSITETIEINDFYLSSWDGGIIETNFEMFLMDLINYQGSFKMNNAVFEDIINITIIYRALNTISGREFSLKNSNFLNVLNSNFMALSNIVFVSFENVTLFNFESPSSSLFSMNSVLVSLFSFFNGIDIFITFPNTLIQNLNSSIILNSSNFINCYTESMIVGYGDLQIENSSFSNIKCHLYFLKFSSSMNLGILIEKSFFKNISLDFYFFLIEKGNFFTTIHCIFEEIQTHSFFYQVEDTLLHNMSSTSIKLSHFEYIWEMNLPSSIIIISNTEISKNIVFISFYRNVIFPNFEFILENSFIFDNNFTQIISGGIFQFQQVGTCSFQQTFFANNTFLYPEKFQYLFEINTETRLFVRNCFFLENGIIKKKHDYFTFSDNCIFSLWATIYTHFNNSIFLVTDKNEFLGGILSADPHTGIFELLNSRLIMKVQNQIFEYKGIQLLNFKSVLMINNTFQGLKCNKKTFNTMHGGVGLFGSSSYKFNRGMNNYWVYLANNSFYGCECSNGAGLAIFGVKSITIENNLFYESKSDKKGGALILVGIESCLVKNVSIISASSKLGGAIYIQNIFEFNAFNISLSNITTQKDAAFFSDHIFILNIFNFTSNQTDTGGYGGIFLLIRSSMKLFAAILIQSFSGLDGGILSGKDRSNVLINTIFVNHSKSKSKAGVLNIKDVVVFVLENACFLDCMAESMGGVFTLDSYNTAVLANVTMINSSSIGGLGVGFISNLEDNSTINLTQIKCNGVFAKKGSCLYFDSGSKILISQLLIENARDNPLYFVGSIFISISVFQLTITRSISSSSLLSIQNIQIKLQNISISNNTVNSILFVIDESEGQILMITFQDNTCIQTLKVCQCDLEIRNLFVTNQTINQNFFDSTASNLKMYQIYFSSTMSQIPQAALFLFLNSTLLIFDSTFLNNEGRLFGFYFCDSVQIKESLFLENNNEVLSSLSMHLEGLLEMSNSIYFFNCRFFVGAELLMSSFQINHVEIKNCSFVSLSTGESIQALFMSDSESISIHNSSFSDFTESSIKILTSISFKRNSSISLLSSFFLNNQANLGGALYIEGVCQMFVSNCFFFGNKAVLGKNQKVSGVGGCIFLKQSSPIVFILLWSYFENNYAEYYAPTIFSPFSLTKDNTSKFLNNSDKVNLTKEIFAFPLFLQLTEKNADSNHTIPFTSGISFDVEFLILDHFNQVLVFDSFSVFSIKKLENQISNLKIKNSISQTIQGIVTFNNLSIKIYPDTYLSLSVAGIWSNPNFGSQYLNLTFNLYSRKCLIGEIITDDLSCIKCPAQTYSLLSPMEIAIKYQKCLICPSHAYCPGGNIIIPLEGYYRFSNTSIAIIPCLTASVCLGFNVPNDCDQECNKSILDHGVCLKGNTGPLCEICEFGYGREDGNKPCKKCDSIQIFVLIRFAVYVSILCLYVFFISLNSQKSKKEKSTRFAVLSKIFITHTQQINLIILAEQNLPFPKIGNILFWLDYFSFSNEYVINNECMIQQFSTIGQGIQRIIINSLAPFLLGFISFILWEVYICFVSEIKIVKNPPFRQLFFCFSLSAFLFYPMIIKSCFGVFQCTQLDPTYEKSFMKINLEKICWENEHLLYILIALPGISIWGLGLPLFLNVLLKKRKHLDNVSTMTNKKLVFVPLKKITSSIVSNSRKIKFKTRVIKQNPFSFFNKGYQMNYIQWESLILLRKFLLCFFSSSSDAFPQETQFVLLFTVLFHSFIITLNSLPYVNRKVNSAEIYSLLICCCSCFGNFLLKLQIMKESLQMVIACFIIILNTTFYCYVVSILILDFVMIIKSFVKRRYF